MLDITLLENSDFKDFPLPNNTTGLKVELNRKLEHGKEIVISPHYNESYISLHLFKLALYCRKHKIKLISIGSMNQLPFFGTFSDEVICLNDTHLHNIYASTYSSFGTDASYFNKIPNYIDIYGGGMGMHGMSEANEIPIDEVIESFSTPPIYIRNSTLEYFRSLSLPSDSIYCEVKTHFYPLLTKLIKENFPNAIGLDKDFQRDLLKKSGDHFMGVQLLASILKGWQFIAAGGSVNLFNVLPVRPLCFLENSEDLSNDFIRAASHFAEKRYGARSVFVNFPSRICSENVPENEDASLSKMEPEDLTNRINQCYQENKLSCCTLYKVSNYKSITPPDIITKTKPNFNNEVKVKINNKVINWVFQYNHDYNFFKKNILDWAISENSETSADPDFTVGVFVNDQNIFNNISDLNSQKFLLSSEAHTRHPVLDNCHSFVQDSREGDDLSYIRYAPTMCCWAPPLHNSGWPSNEVSVVDSGQYDWRVNLISESNDKLANKIDFFGLGFNKGLDGYHCNSNTTYLNEKHQALHPYMFNIAIENKTPQHSGEDYITEKVTDPILCETIPICQSASNLHQYFIEDSYILLSDIDKLDVNNLPMEYAKRRKAILAQKNYIKNYLNVFSYFDKLTSDLSLLSGKRPIKL